MKRAIAFALVLVLCCTAIPVFASEGTVDPMSDLGASLVTIAQNCVKKHLSYPLTAKFLTLYKWQISYNGSTYIVMGTVTAQNAYGVPSEKVCTVWITYTGGAYATPFFTIIGDDSWFE